MWRFRVLIFNKLIEIERATLDEKLAISEDKNFEKIDSEILDEKEKEDGMATKLIRDLSLTYQILLQNPKSYSTWQHRRIILNLLKKVDAGEGEKYVKARLIF